LYNILPNLLLTSWFGDLFGHFSLFTCSRFSLVFDLQSLLHQLINILSKVFIFKFSLLILLLYFLKISALLSLLC
jgi:hypothetical protein